MVVVVVADDDLLDLAVLAHLAPEVLVEGVEVVLQLCRVHFIFRVVGRVLVEVGQEDGLGVGGLDVFAGTAIAVAAGADLVVETAVDFVLFGAEDGGEVVRHGCGGVWGILCAWLGLVGGRWCSGECWVEVREWDMCQGVGIEG